MSNPILSVSTVGFPWQTSDPFLFCVHHLDHYPEGNEQMGPDPELLKGRPIGNDFQKKDGWRMYHGDVVPGFPQHPHRGFETITLARQGFIDHSDSLGATARFGQGDVQWMTAGKGIVHSEAFPLVHRDKPNTTELFQLWLNLPREHKLVDPHFAMFWSEDIPRKTFTDDKGNDVTLTIVAGAFDGLTPPTPPPKSWANNPDHHVGVWTIELSPNATWTIPATAEGVNRSIYLFDGQGLDVAGHAVANERRVQLNPTSEVTLKNGAPPAQVLLLQGKPIDEPVAQQGPFVMNAPGEIRQAMLDYQRTQFGGWPWEAPAPVHPREKGRFAIHIDGEENRPPA